MIGQKIVKSTAGLGGEPLDEFLGNDVEVGSRNQRLTADRECRIARARYECRIPARGGGPQNIPGVTGDQA